MELTHKFQVSVPIDRAWEVLTDLARVAACLPGAELQEVEGEEFRGVVSVKVGPISSQYKGVARILEQDAANHTVVLRAEGRDTRGQGNASATITMVLTGSADRTDADVRTDLTISGKVAQMGRGVLGDVSSKLMDQFVICLESRVFGASADDAQEPSDLPPKDASTSGEPSPTHDHHAPADTAVPVDLLRVGGVALLKRIGPAVVLFVVIALRSVWRRRRGRRST
ncbi:MAG TPA: SRPBCC family protein [Acidimicrobiales bacterium]|jgi:hypothetical protein|nr:SRPBCC family protein [Acidimicrobiales bacterium]